MQCRLVKKVRLRVIHMLRDGKGRLVEPSEMIMDVGCTSGNDDEASSFRPGRV
jgi:hypothetical protein